MSNEKKSATLGMPHGTAVHRLRKNILFSMLKRLGEDVCFKCRKPIESVDELSIEHKLPWEGISAELFWDLANIAFSHLTCNVPNKRATAQPKQRKIGPPGTSWCYRCEKFLPVEQFCKNETRWDGLHNLCKDHQHYNRDNI